MRERTAKFFDRGRAKFRFICDHSIVLGTLLKPIRWASKTLGIGRYLDKVAIKDTPEYQKMMADRREVFHRFCAQHEQQLEKVYNMLEDDFSRRTLKTVVGCRQTGDLSALEEVQVKPQYFQENIFGPVKDEVFVDGGAYLGDTIESFLENFARGGVQKDLCLGTR